MHSLGIVQWNSTRRDHPGNPGGVFGSGPINVCRSSILLNFVFDFVNLLGVFLNCFLKSHMLVFHIDLH